jgi:hypothetical protein
MDILSLAELGETERRLLAIFVQHGRDGRALTMQSLAANAGMAVESKRLAMALNNLAARGFIKRGGGDPLPGSPIAFRLSRPIPRREHIEAIGALEVPDTTWPDRTKGKTHDPIASHHQTAALAAPHAKDDHRVSSRPLDRGISQ